MKKIIKNCIKVIKVSWEDYNILSTVIAFIMIVPIYILGFTLVDHLLFWDIFALDHFIKLVISICGLGICLYAYMNYTIER